jgi:hypothetical protein
VVTDFDRWRGFLTTSEELCEVSRAAALARVKRVVPTFSSFSLSSAFRAVVLYGAMSVAGSPDRDIDAEKLAEAACFDELDVPEAL